MDKDIQPNWLHFDVAQKYVVINLLHYEQTLWIFRLMTLGNLLTIL